MIKSYLHLIHNNLRNSVLCINTINKTEYSYITFWTDEFSFDSFEKDCTKHNRVSIKLENKPQPTNCIMPCSVRQYKTVITPESTFTFLVFFGNDWNYELILSIHFLNYLKFYLLTSIIHFIMNLEKAISLDDRIKIETKSIKDQHHKKMMK